MDLRLTRGPGRPRHIEAVYQTFASKYDRSPRTRETRTYALRKWEGFLARRGVASADVSILDWIAWLDDLTRDGFTRGDMCTASLVRRFYRILGAEQPLSRWSEFAKAIVAHPMPKTIGKKNPYKPLPLRAIPRTLEAAAHLVPRTRAGTEVYNEAPAAVATFIYLGGRAQTYGLTVAQAEQGIADRHVLTFAKEDEEVDLAVHDRLREAWRRHLDDRDFGGPMLFRYGGDAYAHHEGGDWRADVRGAARNRNGIAAILDSVEPLLRARHGIEEHLTAHRFRKSLGTYMEAFGFLEVEQRGQLAHGAKTQTQDYSVVEILRLQRKLSARMDLGSIAWVDAEEAWAEAHDGQYRNLFANGEHETDASLLEELRSLRRQVEVLNGQLVEERSRTRELTDKLIARVVA